MLEDPALRLACQHPRIRDDLRPIRRKHLLPRIALALAHAYARAVEVALGLVRQHQMSGHLLA